MSESVECAKTRKALAGHSAGSLNWLARRRVTRHLAMCGECSAELGRLDAVMKLVESLGEREPPPGLWNGVYNRVSSGERSASRRTSARLVRGLALGAAALLLVLALAFGRLKVNRPLQPADDVVSEYVRGHAAASAGNLFADRFSLNAVSALAGPEHQPERRDVR